MPVVLRSLSDFKKFLRKPGATIQIVQNTFVERQDAASREAYRHKGLYEPRTLRALSKRAAVFDVKGHDTTVWLYWDRGTRHWRFSGDTVTVPLHATLGPPDAVVYRCSLPEPEEPRQSRSREGRLQDARLQHVRRQDVRTRPAHAEPAVQTAFGF